MKIDNTCEFCKGTGSLKDRICKKCYGTGELDWIDRI